MKKLKEIPNSLQDLWSAEELISRNRELILKYPSLEDSLNLLKKVIKMEEVE